jgi:hypothetical protein
VIHLRDLFGKQRLVFLIIGLPAILFACSSDPQTQAGIDGNDQLNGEQISSGEEEGNGNSEQNGTDKNADEKNEFDDQASNNASDLDPTNENLDSQAAGNESNLPTSDLGNEALDINGIETVNDPGAAVPTNTAVASQPNSPLEKPDQVPVNLAPAALDVGPIFLQAPPPVEAALTTKSPYDLPSFDLMPSKSLLWWVGYDFDAAKNLVRIELVTRGAPRYDLRQEKNKAGQPELIVRFYETNIRPKVSRNIDASEFRSPVAYVRMRSNQADESVDVILTLRDPVKPRMYAHNGNVLLTFSVPEKYKGNGTINSVPSASAELLSAADIRPTLMGGSDYPKSLKVPTPPNPSEGVFVGAPENGGNVIQAANAINAQNEISTNLTSDVLDTSIKNEVQNSNSENSQDETNNSDVEQEGNKQQGNPANSQENSDQGQSNQQDEFENPNGQFEEDKSDDFEDGEGDSDSDNEKFDVGSQNLRMPRYSVQSFGLVSVAQDKNQEQFEDDFDNDADGALEGGDGSTDAGGGAKAKNGMNANADEGDAQLNPAGTPKNMCHLMPARCKETATALILRISTANCREPALAIPRTKIFLPEKELKRNRWLRQW